MKGEKTPQRERERERERERGNWAAGAGTVSATGSRKEGFRKGVRRTGDLSQ